MKDFPSDYPKPEWLPDWRDNANYVDHGDDPEHWAWECLRRNPEYQADYARWAALPDTVIAEDGVSVLSPKYKATHAAEWELMTYCLDDPPALDGETVGEYQARTGIEPDLLRIHYCRKWGLEGLGDPSKSIGSNAIWYCEEKFAAPYELHCFKAQLMNYPIMKRGEEGVGKQVMARVMLELGRDDDPRTQGFDHCLESEDYLLLAFDLRDDPKRQADQALELLRQRRQEWQRKKKEAGGPQLSKMVQYLRIFDAVWCGVKQAHIGQHIFKRNADATISTSLTTAKKLILDKGYLTLLR